MKKFGFFLALIAVLTMGTTAFAEFDVKSWDIAISGDMNVTGTATVSPDKFAAVSHDVARTYTVTLKSGDTFALSGDARWWAVSRDRSASADATVSIDTYVKSNDVADLGTYFAIVESKDFSPKVSGKIPSFKLKALSHDATVKVFEITLTPNLSEDISGDIISKDVNASVDMAVTFKFEIAAVPVSGDVPPVSPDVSTDVKTEPVKPVTQASADVYAKNAGFEVEVINGSSYPVVKPTEMQLPVKSMDQNKSLVFPFVTVTISSADTAAKLRISASSNDQKKAIPAASFDVDPKKEAGYVLYKIAPDGKARKLTKVANPVAEGQFGVDNSGNLIVFVEDYVQQPGAAKTYDFDGAKGVIVDPLYAAYINKEGVGGGSSGCSAGYAPFALLFAAPLFFFRKK